MMIEFNGALRIREFLIMFIIRSVFWLAVVVALLPVAPEDKHKVEAISPMDAIGAAAIAMRDFSGFCMRNPKACETGGKAAVAVGYKAKFGAQKLLQRSETINEPVNSTNHQDQISLLLAQIGDIEISTPTNEPVEIHRATPQEILDDRRSFLPPVPRIRPWS